jgi:regulator of replication initiation timing
MKRTGWMLGILMALVVPAGSVAGESAAELAAGNETSEEKISREKDEIEIVRASKSEDPDEAARTYGPLLLRGIKGALDIKREDLALNIIEAIIGKVWTQAESLTMKKLAADRMMRIAAMEKIVREQDKIEKELEELKKIGDSMKAENEVLHAENEALRAAVKPDAAPASAAKPSDPATPEPAEKPKPPLKIDELLAAAREYLNTPAGETQAAREIRQKNIQDRLTGRDFVLTATLQDVKQKGDGAFTVNLRWESGKQMKGRIAFAGAPSSLRMVPAETVSIQAPTSETAAPAWPVGGPMTVRARLTKSEFSNLRGPLEVRIEAEGAQLSPQATRPGETH